MFWPRKTLPITKIIVSGEEAIFRLVMYIAECGGIEVLGSQFIDRCHIWVSSDYITRVIVTEKESIGFHLDDMFEIRSKWNSGHYNRLEKLKTMPLPAIRVVSFKGDETGMKVHLLQLSNSTSEDLRKNGGVPSQPVRDIV